MGIKILIIGCILTAAGVQLIVCLKSPYRILKFLQIAISAAWEAAAWIGVSVDGIPEGMAVLLLIAAVLGRCCTCGAVLGWILYGIVRFVQKQKKKVVV